MLGHVRSYLSSITINCLTSCNYKIILKSSESTGERVRCSKSISSCKFPVCKQNSSICSHCKSLSQYKISLWRSHCYYSNIRSKFVFKLQSQLKSAFVVGVHNTWNSVSYKCSCNRIYFDFGSIRHLFYTNYYIHNTNFYLNKLPAMTIL